MTEIAEQWFIVKTDAGYCEILPDSSLNTSIETPLDQASSDSQNKAPKQWGPYASKSEAIARRVGLIRSGQCQPH